MRGSRGLFARRRCIVPRVTSILIVLLLSALPAATDPNAPAPAAPGRPVSFRVFQNMDKPITGRWQLDIPEGTPRRIELKELVAGEGSALVGVDIASGEELLRLDRKKEGIGYAGEMKKVFAPCGLDPLPVREFLPLGDSIQVRFETAPPEIACPPIDSGKAGRLEAFAAGGSSLRLRDLSELSSAETRDTYSIGELAREFGVTTRTIRHYEQEGLLTPERNGHVRVFSRRDRVRLRLANGEKHIQELGRVRAEINGDEEPTLVIFGEAGSSPAIGAYTLEGLALGVDPVEGRLVPMEGWRA